MAFPFLYIISVFSEYNNQVILTFSERRCVMYGGILKKLVIVALAALVLWAVIKFLFPIVLPFALAWAVAACLQPAVRLISKRVGIGRRPVACALVILSVLGLGLLAFFLVSRFLSELGGFLSAISENTEGGVGGFFDKLKSFLEKIPFISAMGADISDTVEAAMKSILSDITAAIPSLIGKLIGAIPGFFIFTVVIIMSTYYFAADFDGIRQKVYGALPAGMQRRWDRFKERLKGAGIQYLKACVALSFITFTELTVGFLVLGIPYALTLAIVIALVDMFPILGSGTVLIPWAVFEWATGNGYLAVGLLIILAVVTVVRQFAEPRVISSGIGLSPITTLVAMYIGFKLFGLGGLFLAPLFAVIILSALPDGVSAALGMELTESKNKRKSLNICSKNQNEN